MKRTMVTRPFADPQKASPVCQLVLLHVHVSVCPLIPPLSAPHCQASAQRQPHSLQKETRHDVKQSPLKQTDASTPGHRAQFQRRCKTGAACSAPIDNSSPAEGSPSSSARLQFIHCTVQFVMKSRSCWPDVTQPRHSSFVLQHLEPMHTACTTVHGCWSETLMV